LLSQAQHGNGEIFIQLNENGHLKQGSMHVKAIFDSDHQKSFLIDFNEQDESIATLRERIGKRMQ
jgi:hypothetical protein